MRTYTGGATSSFTGRLSNEFRLNYSSNYAASRDAIDAFGGGTPVDLVQLSGLNTGSFSAPGTELGFVYGANVSLISQVPLSGAQRQWNFVDTVSLSWRRHQFKFGVDCRRLAPSAIQSNTLFVYG